MDHTPAWLINSFIFLSATVIAVPLSRALGLGTIIGFRAAGIARLGAAVGMWFFGVSVMNVASLIG